MLGICILGNFHNLMTAQQRNYAKCDTAVGFMSIQHLHYSSLVNKDTAISHKAHEIKLLQTTNRIS